MLVRTLRDGDRECRAGPDLFFEASTPRAFMSGFGGASGFGLGGNFGAFTPAGDEIWRAADALTLPAVSAAIRLIAETVASLPLLVYRTGPGGVRERAVDSWQHRLLHDQGPNDDTTTFDFLSDVAACLEASGNAYIEKLPMPGGELQLYVIDPTRVHVKRATDGSKIFEARSPDGLTKQLGSDRILHVRGFTIDGSPVGLSPIGLHRRSLGLIASRDEYERQFFLNGASPGGAIEVPGHLDEDKVNEMARAWRAHHQGPGRWHQPAILQNGATWKSIGVSLADAQFAESSKFSVEQVARIFRVPPMLLGLEPNRPISAEEEAARFLKFGLGPRLKRIERAFAADPDLFPPQLGLQPEFLADGLLRALTPTRYEAYKAARQAGWLTANEIRAYENMPPDPRGNELQATPVGGAPNPP
jgi:HK97 family phage portal protein